MLQSRAACLCLGLLTAVSSPLSADQPFFLGLGTLPGSSQPVAQATGVSADGKKVIAVPAALWTQETGVSVLAGSPFAISSDGTTIGGIYVNRPGVLRDGQWSNLSPPLPSDNGAVRGVSADGSVIVGSTEQRAFRLQGSNVTFINQLPGGTSGNLALAVNGNGSVVVGYSASAQGTQAYRWVNGSLQGLGDLDGGIFWSEARAVSADGSTVVGFGSPLPSGLYRKAFRWTQTGGMVGLGFLPGATSSEAFGVSGDGSVVVGVSQYAFIWDAQHGMRKLEDVLVHDLGLDLQGFLQIGAATAITPDGKTIVGYGLNSQFYQEAWIAHIPEPATLILLAAGCAVLTRRSGRRPAC